MTRWLLPYLLLASAAHAQLSQPFMVGTTTDATRMNTLFQDLYDKTQSKGSISALIATSVAAEAAARNAAISSSVSSAISTEVTDRNSAIATAIATCGGFHSVDPPNAVDGWISGTVVSDTDVALSGDGVAAGAIAVVLRIGLRDASDTRDLYVCEAGRATGAGDIVSRVNTISQYTTTTVKVDANLVVHAKFSVNNALDMNNCYVVGYFK